MSAMTDLLQRIVLSGAPARFTPKSVPNLKLWLDASQISGKSDGDTVALWPDSSGNSNTGVASGTPLYRSSVINSRPGVEYITSGRKHVTPAFLGAGFNTAFAVYAVVNHTPASSVVWAGNGAGKYFGGAEFTTNFIAHDTTGLSAAITYIAEPGSSYMTSMRYDGTNKSLFSVGATKQISDIVAATGNLGLSGALTVGTYDGATGFTWDGQICELLIYNGISAANDALVTKYLQNKYSLNWSTRPLLMFDGNSLTSGINASGPSAYYPTQTVALLGASAYDYQNIGVPSATTAQRTAADPTVLDPFVGNNRAKNIAILWEITNDLADNQDPSGAYSRVVSWCQGRRSAGFKVIVGTCPPTLKTGIYAGFEADRQTVNAQIRANWAGFADGLADIGNDPTIGQAGDPNNATFYGSDKVHLTDAGYAIVAGIVATAINAL